jgi:hypothetical protein
MKPNRTCFQTNCVAHGDPPMRCTVTDAWARVSATPGGLASRIQIRFGWRWRRDYGRGQRNRSTSLALPRFRSGRPSLPREDKILRSNPFMAAAGDGEPMEVEQEEIEVATVLCDLKRTLQARKRKRQRRGEPPDALSWRRSVLQDGEPSDAGVARRNGDDASPDTPLAFRDSSVPEEPLNENRKKKRKSLPEDAAVKKAREQKEDAAKKAREKAEAAAATKARLKEEAAAKKAREQEAAAIKKAREKAEVAARKAREKVEAAAKKAREKAETAAKKAREKAEVAAATKARLKEEAAAAKKTREQEAAAANKAREQAAAARKAREQVVAAAKKAREQAAAARKAREEEEAAAKKAREEEEAAAAEEDRAHQEVSSPRDMFFCSISE